MKIEAFLNLISLMLMICLIFYLTQRLASIKHSIYKCFIRKLFYGDNTCHNWLMANDIYIWYLVMDVALIVIFLGLNSQFAKDAVQYKPLINFMASPALWLSMIMLLYRNEKRMERMLKKL